MAGQRIDRPGDAVGIAHEGVVETTARKHIGHDARGIERLVILTPAHGPDEALIVEKYLLPTQRHGRPAGRREP